VIGSFPHPHGVVSLVLLSLCLSESRGSPLIRIEAVIRSTAVSGQQMVMASCATNHTRLQQGYMYWASHSQRHQRRSRPRSIASSSCVDATVVMLPRVEGLRPESSIYNKLPESFCFLSRSPSTAQLHTSHADYYDLHTLGKTPEDTLPCPR